MDNGETEQQRKIFHQLDENNDGVLTREELVKGFRNFYGDMAEIHVDEIMKMADLNGNGSIDYTEWLAATLNKQKLLNDTKLRIAFDYFDKDKSGKIDKFELKSVMGSKRKLVDDSVWDSIIAEVD
jgi:calcium-dependent protein kinase